MKICYVKPDRQAGDGRRAAFRLLCPVAASMDGRRDVKGSKAAGRAHCSLTHVWAAADRVMAGMPTTMTRVVSTVGFTDQKNTLRKRCMCGQQRARQAAGSRGGPGRWSRCRSR